MLIFLDDNGLLPELLLVFARVAGIFLAAPVFSARQFPVRARVGFAVFLTLVLFPVVEVGEVPQGFMELWIRLISETFIGYLLGFTAFLVVAAAQVAGQFIDVQMGFGLVSVLDPNFGTQMPLIGNFKSILLLVTFLAVNGHHLLLRALKYSFTVLPVGSAYGKGLGVVADTMIALVGRMFVTALEIALPIMGVLLLADICLGIIARIVPQMNVFIVGLPAKIMLGLLALFIVIPVLPGIYAGLVRGIGADLEEFLQELAEVTR